MEQADKKQRSFLSRWWILIVIVLWLIAWSARDVLAPSAEMVPEDEDVEAVAVAEDDPAAEARTPASPPREEQVARQVQEALEAGRAAYWGEGPEAAAAVLQTALADIPATAAQRADLYGELGNALYAAGDARGAMRAWDSALDLLPASERRVMVERLAPVYARHHRDGARHLRQFR